VILAVQSCMVFNLEFHFVVGRGNSNHKLSVSDLINKLLKDIVSNHFVVGSEARVVQLID
jgi:hypothetical protein